MFSSIRWKFVTVYFVLVFLAMSIVGIFIVGKLETQQIENLTDSMEKHIETVVESSSYIGYDNWNKFSEEIQDTLNDWRLGINDTLYVISNDNVPVIIASTSKNYNKIIDENALSSKYIDTSLLLTAIDGEKVSKEIKDKNSNISNQHLAYPVISDVGRVKGVLYMTSDLSSVYKTVDDSKLILTNATLLALIITVFLGFIIANNITTPIRDLTSKAEEMAKGDFDQFVEVKSTDEIGQLANMFNYLTLELKERIKEIDYERSKLETMFKYMAEGVVAISKDDKIIHANIHGEEILGLSKDQIKGKEKVDYKLLDIDSINYEDSKTLEGATIKELNEKYYKIKHAPFKTEKGSIGGIILVLQDITKEHELEIMRKEFVANVSHELKTPITTIKSYTETIINSNMDNETRVSFLNIIDEECDRMNRLVQDLLQLSNFDYKKVRWNKRELSINKLIEDVLLKLKLSAKDKDIKIKTNLDKNISDIYFDKDGIEQVLLNIISNAIKYTNNFGNILISSKDNSKEIIVTVEDDGYGISEEDLERIFERFYRVEKGRSREMGGTGLGLSIAKEIIESHNGSLDIESELGKGTNVIIHIPK